MAVSRVVRVIATNLVVFGALVLIGDFLLTMVVPLPANADKEFRILDPQFSHTFRPNFSTDRAMWGNERYWMHTNSLGFKDAKVRQVAKTTDKAQRLVFIGDSFTEGAGMRWEDTFVGIFAERVPNIEVLNAGTLSYSPSIYFRKAKWLLDAGYAFDELVVYMDVSDIQDEASVYRETEGGDIVYGGYEINYLATLADPQWQIARADGGSADEPDRGPKEWLRSHFAYSNVLYSILKEKIKRQREPTRKLLRSYWTIDPNIPGYGELGVEGGIRKSIAYMDRLAALLAAKGIRLSVAVYPWPDQLEYDTEGSRQVVLWRDWCARSGCAHFIDHFPDFFAFTRKHADWRTRLFIADDVHYSRAANELIAARLESTFVPSKAAPAR